MTLDFASAWKARNGGFHSERTASVAMFSQNVTIGEEEEKLLNNKTNPGDLGSGRVGRDWMIPVVRSANSKEKGASLGNFSLTVTVVETTETGADIVGLVAETLRGKKSDIIDAVITLTPPGT